MPVPVIDMTGEVCGKWTVIARVENDSSGGARWECSCSCGRTVAVLSGSKLRQSKTQQCVSCAYDERHANSQDDPVGTVHGSWTVVERAAPNKWRERQWLCCCTCGRSKTVNRAQMRAAKMKRCEDCDLRNWRTGSSDRIIPKKGTTNHRRPSRSGGTPDTWDAYLHSVMPEDVRLAFYRQIGGQAVREALADAQRAVKEDSVFGQPGGCTPLRVQELLNRIDPAHGGGPYPSQLPLGE